MQSLDHWPRESRIVEIDPVTGALAEALLTSGCCGYLGVVRDAGRAEALAQQHPALRDRLAITAAGNPLRQNNADVLILNGDAARQIIRFRSFRHARYVAWPVVPSATFVLAVVASLMQWLLGRVTWPRFAKIAAAGNETCTARLLVCRVRRPRQQSGARHFIPHALGVEGFLRELHARGVRHAVLRWFETLPHVPPGEDLDVLVDDADLDTVRALLDNGPGVQPIDLYSVTGLPGAEFRNMPYYPPYLAEELLDRAIDFRGLCQVPAPREHFLSLAYHALYHKGASSGLPRRDPARPRVANPEHDYPAILQSLAEQLGVRVPITVEDLDEYLDAQSWRPPHDMLVRLARRNRWMQSLLQHAPQADGDDRRAVFLLRREALARGGVARAVALLEGHGFDVVETRTFAPDQVERLARSLRGGNWGRGPWPISGGQPVAAIVTYDQQPITPSRRQRKRFPFLANARLLCKDQIRDEFNRGLPPERHCNVVHSSDNGREANEYLRIIGPAQPADQPGRAKAA